MLMSWPRGRNWAEDWCLGTSAPSGQGNSLHPEPAAAELHHREFRDTVRVASQIGVGRAIGLPATDRAVTEGNPFWEEMREIVLHPEPTVLLDLSHRDARQKTGAFAGGMLADLPHQSKRLDISTKATFTSTR